MASYTRIKICGFTGEAEALAAQVQGADAIGLNFYPPSPRWVAAEQARDIALAVGPFVTVTALFVNPSPAEVDAVLSKVNVHLLQFHGDESPEFCQQFQRPYIKALRIPADQLHKDQARAAVLQEARRYSDAQGILLDTYSANAYGGTGERFNWDAVPDADDIRWILAGGLDADNVAEAITAVRPYAVDVSSGVESSRGVKDAEKIRQFIQSVRSVQ